MRPAIQHRVQAELGLTVTAAVLGAVGAQALGLINWVLVGARLATQAMVAQAGLVTETQVKTALAAVVAAVAPLPTAITVLAAALVF